MPPRFEIIMQQSLGGAPRSAMHPPSRRGRTWRRHRR